VDGGCHDPTKPLSGSFIVETPYGGTYRVNSQYFQKPTAWVHTTPAGGFTFTTDAVLPAWIEWQNPVNHQAYRDSDLFGEHYLADRCGSPI
jgi:hypothetical protein